MFAFQMYLLGFDIGSSTLKAAIVEAETHKVVAIESYPETEMDMIARKSGWAEQSPEVWWQNLCTLTRRLLVRTRIKNTDIKAIGISYQMHGLVLIDENQHVLRPAIIWCDSRAVEIGRTAFQELGEMNCLKSLLNAPGNFTASKLKWVKDNEPETYRRIKYVLLPGDYIAMKLTGQIFTTILGLSEGVFWDFKQNKVSQAILDYYGFSSEILPEITPVFSIQGTLTREAAEMTGLHIGTKVTYRAGDQPNNALSLNVIRPGEVAATSGTSGVVYGVFDRPIYDTKSRINAFAHVNHSTEKQRIGALLCINGAGIQYSWMKHQVAREGLSYNDMERIVSSTPVGSDGLCILPFGNGAERMLADQNLNAHVLNLEFNRHTRAHLYRAALEGVAFSFVHGINILKEIGLVVDVLRVGNDNMFQSRVFSTTIATLLDLQIEMVETTGAVGAARAAGVAAGVYKSLEEALEGIRPTEVFEPEMDKGLCSQAYNYWSSMLENKLSQKGNKSNAIERVRQNVSKLHQELDDKSQELNKISMKLMAKNELLEQMGDAITRIQKLGDLKSIQIELKKMTRRIQESEEHESAWGLIEERFNISQDGFIAKLKSEYPDITIDELKLCALLKLQLTNKELAQYFNLSVRGIETRRYRLRKKLGIDIDTDIALFLNSLTY
jgi:xylulokinase